MNKFNFSNMMFFNFIQYLESIALLHSGELKYLLVGVSKDRQHYSTSVRLKSELWRYKVTLEQNKGLEKGLFSSCLIKSALTSNIHV